MWKITNPLQSTVRKVQQKSLIILRTEKTHEININSKENKNKIMKHISPCILSHSNENWTIEARDTRRITRVKMNYTRKLTGYTWTDYETNTENANELNITPVLEKIQDRRRSWTKHIN